MMNKICMQRRLKLLKCVKHDCGTKQSQPVSQMIECIKTAVHVLREMFDYIRLHYDGFTVASS